VVEKKIAGESDGVVKNKPGWAAHAGSQNPKGNTCDEQ
jgi:hypothetical protein